MSLLKFPPRLHLRHPPRLNHPRLLLLKKFKSLPQLKKSRLLRSLKLLLPKRLLRRSKRLLPRLIHPKLPPRLHLRPPLRHPLRLNHPRPLHLKRFKNLPQ